MRASMFSPSRGRSSLIASLLRYDTFVIDTVVTLLGLVYGANGSSEPSYLLTSAVIDHNVLQLSVDVPTKPWVEGCRTNRHFLWDDRLWLSW